jgi:glutathione S-transferase
LPELYDHILSDRCYTVRLLLGLVAVEYEKRTVGFVPTQTPSTPEAPGGELPVFVDGDAEVRGVSAIVLHICAHYDVFRFWRGDDPDVRHWLDFATRPLAAASDARNVMLFNAPGDGDALVARARDALRIIEDRLLDQTLRREMYLVAAKPCLADVAVFPAVALSHDCGIGHEDYPAINLWQRRIRRLPGFVSMPGIPDYF